MIASSCEWWLLYRTGATNWPDGELLAVSIFKNDALACLESILTFCLLFDLCMPVIGQIVWPLTHLVIIVSFCDSGWNEGAAVACEQEIQTLCGTSFSHFISGRLS
jgi:hypothetical protein